MRILLLAATQLLIIIAIAQPPTLKPYRDPDTRLMGYKDAKTGAVVIEPKYEVGSPFSKNGTQWFALVGINELYGYIDPTDKPIIPLKYQRLHSPSEGLIAAKQNDKWGYISFQNKILIPFQFTQVSSFQKNGNLILAGARKDKWGYIDIKGNFIIPQQYDSVQNFGKELAPVLLNKKWGYINTKGGNIIPHEFDYAKGFVNDTAIVVKNDVMYLLNPKGQKVEPSTVSMSEWLATEVKYTRESIERSKEYAKMDEEEAKLPLKLNFFVGSAKGKIPEKDADKKAQEVWDIHKDYIEKTRPYYQEFNKKWAKYFWKGYDSTALVDDPKKAKSDLWDMTRVRINTPYIQRLKDLGLAKGENPMADTFMNFLEKQNAFFNEVFQAPKYFGMSKAEFTPFIKRLQSSIETQKQAQILLYQAAKETGKRNKIKV